MIFRQYVVNTYSHLLLFSFDTVSHTSHSRALEDTVLPLSGPIRATDGTLLHEIAVPRGTNILVSILACNRDKALWGADADEWKPERWLAPLPAEVESAAIPGVYSNM